MSRGVLDVRPNRTDSLKRSTGRPSITGWKWRRTLGRSLPALVFLLPTILLMGVLRIWPLEESIRLSFTNWDGFSPPTFIGFANYRELFDDPNFWQALLNNGKILIAVPLFVALPFLISAALQSRIPGWRIFRAAFFFPTLLSPVIIALTFGIVLRQDGPLNSFLHVIGLDFLVRNWLVDPHWAIIWVIAILAWALIGVGTVIFLAAMGSVDRDLMESARMDGASWFGVQRNVVFWQILPVIELWTVLVLIGTLTQFFPLILLLTNGGPGHDTTTADLFAYQAAFSDYRSGYASAATVIILLVTVVLMGLCIGLFRRGRST